MTIRVGVFGAAGKVGREICAAIESDPELTLAAAVDPFAVGKDISGVTCVAEPSGQSMDVMVDFTVLEAALANLEWSAANGVHAVVGTTGFSEDDLHRIRDSLTSSNCLIAPNFAIGAVLMMRFAELAAPFFESAEVIELHHDAKIDAPSGTAMKTMERMAAASADWGRDPTEIEIVPGARGGVGPGGIPVHSIRLRGLVAHQEVLLGTTGQTLSIRHDSIDRTSFIPGVLLAVKRIADEPGLTVGLDGLLGL